MADWLKKLVLARNEAVFLADWLKKLVLARNEAVFVADWLYLPRFSCESVEGTHVEGGIFSFLWPIG